LAIASLNAAIAAFKSRIATPRRRMRALAAAPVAGGSEFGTISRRPLLR